MSNLHKKAKRQKLKNNKHRIFAKINHQMVCLMNFNTVNESYSMGTILDVVDVFSENGGFFMAIKTKYGIQEIGFRYPNAINNKDELLTAASSFLVPYVADANYYSVS